MDCEVEFSLTQFCVGANEGQLQEKLHNTPLKYWASKRSFIPEDGIHYNKIASTGILKSFLPQKSDPCQENALATTHEIFNEVYTLLEILTNKGTGYKQEYTKRLLLLVDDKIETADQSTNIKNLFTFTIQYKIEMYLIACSISIPKFDQMAKLFQEKNDPLHYLEKNEKNFLFTKFKIQYDQIETEDAIADTLCAYLKEPIKAQINKFIGRKMVTKMKSSGKEYSSKMALKVKVLTDLHRQDIFENYMHYVLNIRRCLQEFIENYTVTYCDEQISENTTRLQKTAKEEVTRLVEVIKNVVTDTNEVSVHGWLKVFSKNKSFRNEIGVNLKPQDIVSCPDTSQKLDLESFKLKMNLRLQELRHTLHTSYDDIECGHEMRNWRIKPHEIIAGFDRMYSTVPFLW